MKSLEKLVVRFIDFVIPVMSYLWPPIPFSLSTLQMWQIKGCPLPPATGQKVGNVGNTISAALNRSTGISQGCSLSPRLFPLYTHVCPPINSATFSNLQMTQPPSYGLLRETMDRTAGSWWMRHLPVGRKTISSSILTRPEVSLSLSLLKTIQTAERIIGT